MTNQPQKPVCSWCGSDRVLADAYVEWNALGQYWIVGQVFDKAAFCSDCEEEASIEWMNV